MYFSCKKSNFIIIPFLSKRLPAYRPLIFPYKVKAGGESSRHIISFCFLPALFLLFTFLMARKIKHPGRDKPPEKME